MKFISVLWILIIILKVTKAKNGNINRIVSKTPKPPIFIFKEKGTIGLFPRLPIKGTELTIDLNPPVENYSKANQPELYEKSVMQEPIKEKNYKNSDIVKAEVTTRRSLMPTHKFIVRPHDVYPQSGCEKYNWYSNRQRTNKLPRNKNIYNSNRSENQYHSNSYVTPRSRKLKTTLVFRKRNNTRYFKENPEEISKRIPKNNFVFKSRIPLKAISKSNDVIIEEKQNIIVPHSKFIKTDSKDQIDVTTDQIAVVNDHSEEMTTDIEIEYLVSRPKRSVNIIEEESVATTFSGIKITNQEYPSHDLTFKNIHT